MSEIRVGDPGFDLLWAVRRATRPPPREVRDNESWNLCRKATFTESDRKLLANTECPIDPGWVEDDVLRIDTIADHFFFFTSRHREEHEKFLNQGQIKNFWTERLVLSIYQDLCSCTVGILRDQLDTATTIQVKVVGLMASLFIAFTNFLFKGYVAPELTE